MIPMELERYPQAGDFTDATPEEKRHLISIMKVQACAEIIADVTGVPRLSLRPNEAARALGRRGFLGDEVREDFETHEDWAGMGYFPTPFYLDWPAYLDEKI